MRRGPARLALALAALLACAPAQTVRAPEPPFARAAVVHMGVALTAAATQCTMHAQWLAKGGARFDVGAEARATELSETCIRRLIPPRDALAFGVDVVDPWTPKSATVLGCAGKAVRVALEGLRGDFVMFGVRVPATMADGEHLGRWAEQWAAADCDPLHPTTTVVVTHNPLPPEGTP